MFTLYMYRLKFFIQQSTSLDPHSSCWHALDDCNVSGRV